MINNIISSSEDYLCSEEDYYTGVLGLLRKMGKKYKPSEAQVNLYRKWVDEWHFSPQIIDTVVDTIVVRGDPSLGYLEGVLYSLRCEYGDGKNVTQEVLRADNERADRLKAVLRVLGRETINSRTLAMMNHMLQLYPMEVILIGAKECGRCGKRMEDLQELLEGWHKKGLDTYEKVKNYVQDFHEQTKFILQLRSNWGINTNHISKIDRATLTRWEKEMGMSRELILFAAQLASSAEIKNHMTYLGKILENFNEKGIRTPEDYYR